jgi:phospholipase/carboxylesterase
MNRIALDTDYHPCPTTSTEPANVDNLPDLAAATCRRIEHGLEVPYTTFAPIHYEERYAYPLLVWLHGAASSEHELRHVMPLVSMRNYVAIAPRGTSSDTHHPRRFDWQQSTDAIAAAETSVADCIAVARRRFNVHDRRVFLVGCGSGGTMALRVAWNNPQQYAGVVAINGPLPTRLTPLSRVNELRRVPCLLITSRESRAYPANNVCRDLRLLHVAGCTVALRQYPGDDELATNMLSDLDRWLMERVCGSTPASQSVIQ